MNDLANVVSTGSHGWQARCAEWARNGEPFRIRGIGARHLAFCKDLCDRHNYKFNYDSADKEFTGIFVPLE